MEKIREKKLVYYIENRSIKISFILYALISLVVGITISVTAIALVDNYRMNLNYKYEDMTTRYDIPENGSFIAKYNKFCCRLSKRTPGTRIRLSKSCFLY